MRTYQDGRFTYAELSQEQINQLNALPVEEDFISEPTINKIRKILNLKEINNEELQGTRNSVVKELRKIKNEARDKKDWKTFDDTCTRISMITCVIDAEKWKRGMAV